jgi:hypothetical protein
VPDPDQEIKAAAISAGRESVYADKESIIIYSSGNQQE